MQKYLKLMNQLVQEFDQVDFTQIRRRQNSEADEVARQASSEEGTSLLNLKVEVQRHLSIEELHTFMIQKQTSWMNPIISFLQDGRLPIGTNEAREAMKRAARFTVLNDTLYKRGFSMPKLRCVEEDGAKYILEEVYEGICGDHTGSRSLVSKIIRTSYY